MIPVISHPCEGPYDSFHYFDINHGNAAVKFFLSERCPLIREARVFHFLLKKYN